MEYRYRKFDNYNPVDLDKLRPKKSYDGLIKKRTHTIDLLIKKFGKIPDDLLNERNCPTCNSNESLHELDKDYLSLVRCQKCDLVYTNPIFDETHYIEAYSSSDYQEIVKNLGESSHDYRVERFGSERVQLMSKYINKKTQIKYLDVGCSTGFVVEAATNSGWDAVGIDLNPSAISFGKKRGLNLHEKALENIDFDLGFFDAISLFDVIEHLTNPMEILLDAKKYLSSGGILFLYVPNYDSASRILMGKDAHFIWPTHHLNYYTPVTISDLLDRAGFEIRYLVTEGLDLFDYIWHTKNVRSEETIGLEEIADKLQFFINAGCYGKNLRVIASKR